MGEAFLRAHGDNGLRLGINIHIITSFVPVTDCAAQIWNAAGNGVTVVDRLLRRLNEFVDNVLRCRLIRIAHGHIDDINVLMTQVTSQISHNIESIGRKTKHTRKFFHGELDG